MMDASFFEVAFKWLFGGVVAVLCWAAKELWNENKEIKKSFTELSLKVVSEYVHKTDLHEYRKEVREMTEKINDKLETLNDRLSERMGK